MAATTKKDYITFSNGINTETNLIKEEEGTCSELSNFRLNKDGSIEKRGGLLPTHSLITSTNNSTDKPEVFLWKNVAGNPDDNFYVVSQGGYLSFFQTTTEFSAAGKEPFAVNLLDHTTLGYNSGDVINVKMISGEGYLFVAGKLIEPLVITYDKEKKVMEVKAINIKIRDYLGIKDNIKDITEYPLIYTDEAVYNAVNQGFSENQIADYYNTNGCLPCKADSPKYFKYLRVYTSQDDIKKPEEVYDYSLLLQNNYGTSKSPTGKKILDVFKRKRELESSKLTFKIGLSNILAVKRDFNDIAITFKSNRLPNFNQGQVYQVDAIQTGFDAVFPSESKLYRDKNIGLSFDYLRDTPVVTNFTRNVADFNGKMQIYEGFDIDAPWNATPTITEAEYKSHDFLYNECIMVRNTGEHNQYILITNSDFAENYFKENLVDEIGGTVEEEFLLPGSLNLTDEQKGKYIRIQTNANTDNQYFLRQVLTLDYPSLFWYNSKEVDGFGNPIIASSPLVKVNSILSECNSSGNGYKLTYLSDTVAEFRFGLKLKYNGTEDTPTLPDGYNDYIFNWSGADPDRSDWRPDVDSTNGRYVFGLEKMLSQLTIEKVLSEDPVVVSSDEEKFRPAAIEFYANRVFYANYDSEDYYNYIFFSQMESLTKNAGNCYTRNDPTDEYMNAILATDGGYLVVPEADRILNLVTVKNKLVVLARNSVYAISGDPYFSASNYSITKVSDIGIVSPDAFEIVGETIVFASDDGLYNFNIDNFNGDLLSNNFSNAKIRKIYSSLTREQKENIKISYNPYEKKICFMLNTNTSLAPNFYDTILNYDFDLQAFYMYNIGRYSNYQLVDFFEEYIYNRSRPSSLLYYDNTNGSYGVLVENMNKFKDYDELNTNYTCTLETNYINFNDIIRNKRVRRLKVFGDNERESECDAFIKYDSSLISNKWSKSENIFRLQAKTNGSVHMHQQVCRGDGLFFKLRLESNVDKPCKILGWSMTVDGNQQI